MFGAVGVLVVALSIPLQPMTRSVGFVVVTLPVHDAPVPWVLVAVASRGLVAAMPAKDVAAISPWTTEPENVAVITVPAGRPMGALAEAIAA